MSIGNVAIVSSRQSTDLSHDVASALSALAVVVAVVLLPAGRIRTVFVFFGLLLIMALILAEILIVSSNILLQVTPFMMALSVVTVFLMVPGVVALGVGLGAAYPDFQSENPAQSVTSFGGLLFLLLAAGAPHCLLEKLCENLDAIGCPNTLNLLNNLGTKLSQRSMMDAGIFCRNSGVGSDQAALLMIA